MHHRTESIRQFKAGDFKSLLELGDQDVVVGHDVSAIDFGEALFRRSIEHFSHQAGVQTFLTMIFKNSRVAHVKNCGRFLNAPGPADEFVFMIKSQVDLKVLLRIKNFS